MQPELKPCVEYTALVEHIERRILDNYLDEDVDETILTGIKGCIYATIFDHSIMNDWALCGGSITWITEQFFMSLDLGEEHDHVLQSMVPDSSGHPDNLPIDNLATMKRIFRNTHLEDALEYENSRRIHDLTEV